ncbi:dienelactone hydrolase [Silvibacterium bohemicum]|uniref:Dienelactone hydrolase n=1 Tax=Silvibacterium bohemicum TaxID=1577686 RepID=A0A841JWF0_9BACT|nr:CocE/NonD family hydrolase [Silvibacterium bohemicum]MBB6144885.1 dienelactone hydrolase [Silvibacterium bohemicum]
MDERAPAARRCAGKILLATAGFSLACSMAWGQATTNSAPAQPGADPPAVLRYIEDEVWAPVPNSFPRGLDVLEVYADRPGKHPLALLTHGTSNIEQERQHVTPWAQLGQALWFARRGYVAIVIVRKGYGRSGGEPDRKLGGCKVGGSFREAGEASAQDLRAVAKWAAQRPEVDASTLVSAGVSTGGFAQAALTEDPPKELKAAISFAGGRGGDGKEHECNLGGAIDAFQDFGKGAAKHGAVPMLWIYSQNDHWFPPSMATQFEDAYRKAGGSVEFVLALPDGEDGHHLYAHVEAWSATVESFLRARDLLPLGDEVLPLPAAPNVPPPAGVSERGLNAWKRYLVYGPYKAFAVSSNGEWGSTNGAFDQQLADQDAMDRCRKAATEGAACQIVSRTAPSK